MTSIPDIKTIYTWLKVIRINHFLFQYKFFIFDQSGDKIWSQLSSHQAATQLSDQFHTMWTLAIVLLLTLNMASCKEFSPASMKNIKTGLEKLGFKLSVLGKNRLVFKSFLYDYVAKKSGPEFKVILLLL